MIKDILDTAVLAVAIILMWLAWGERRTARRHVSHELRVEGLLDAIYTLGTAIIALLWYLA